MSIESLLVINFGIGVPSAGTTPVSSPQFGSSPRSNLRTSRKKVIPILNHQHTCLGRCAICLEFRCGTLGVSCETATRQRGRGCPNVAIGRFCTEGGCRRHSMALV
ncbi:unnamed protein product [Prunus armeniaca]